MSVKYDFEAMVNSDSVSLNREVLVACLSERFKLFYAFRWSSSPQGMNYWDEIYTDGHTPESLQHIRDMIRQWDQEKGVRLDEHSGVKVGDWVVHGQTGNVYQVSKITNNLLSFDGYEDVGPYSLSSYLYARPDEIPAEAVVEPEVKAFPVGSYVVFKDEHVTSGTFHLLAAGLPLEVVKSFPTFTYLKGEGLKDRGINTSLFRPATTEEIEQLKVSTPTEESRGFDTPKVTSFAWDLAAVTTIQPAKSLSNTSSISKEEPMSEPKKKSFVRRVSWATFMFLIGNRFKEAGSAIGWLGKQSGRLLFWVGVPALVVASHYGLIDWSSVWNSVVELCPVSVEWK